MRSSFRQRPPVPSFPPIERFATWIRKQLRWPPDAPLTSGAFDILDDRFHWEWRADLEHRWALEDILPTIRRDNLSARGMVGLWRWSLQHPERPLRRSQMPDLPSTLRAELALEKDWERYGSRHLRNRGLDSYLELLDPSEVSEHERMETALSWQERGFFSERDTAFCARFEGVLESHAAWLNHKSTGHRARLCGRDLREVTWTPGALRHADLRGVEFSNLNLGGENFSGCDLRGANLLAARFVGANLQDADLRQANLELALFQNANLSGAKTDKWILSMTNVTDWDGRGIAGPSHPGVKWHFDWSGLDLRGRSFANFQTHFRANDCANFRGANLEAASFRNSHGATFDFRGANLRNADFSLFSCEWKTTSFDGADLTGANFWAADLRDSHFENAILADVQNAEYAQWNENPPSNPDFKNGDFSGAHLFNRNFEGCNFSGANFYCADLRQANFANANLQNADLRRADLGQANFSGANLNGARYSPTKMRLAKR